MEPLTWVRRIGSGLLGRRRRAEAAICHQYPAWLRTEPAVAIPASAIGISVLMPVRDTPAPHLREAIASVRAQTHQAWELCIVDDASTLPHVQDILADAAASDGRITFQRTAGTLGIADASNAALTMASLPFVALLDHDDLLAPHALARMAREIDDFPDSDMVFSDEDHLVRGQRANPYFKPGWNRDLLLGQNLVCHLAVFRRVVVVALGGLRRAFDGSQDYDLALRVASVTPDHKIRHVPDILYHWRQSDSSYSTVKKAACEASARRALQHHLGPSATAEPNQIVPQWLEARFARRPRTTDDVMFLADDAEAPDNAWRHLLAAQLDRPGVGCAGARIDDSHGRIVHAGWILHPQHIAQTLAPGSDAGDPGYRGQFCLMRTASAVSSQGMAVKRALFRDMGGLDTRAGIYADVDFCLRLAEAGLRCVWLPQARLRSLRTGPVRDDPDGAAYMRERWASRLARDAFLNPHLVVAGGRLLLAKAGKAGREALLF